MGEWVGGWMGSKWVGGCEGGWVVRCRSKLVRTFPPFFGLPLIGLRFWGQSFHSYENLKVPNLLTITDERFQCPEALFNPREYTGKDLLVSGIHSMVAKSVLEVGLDLVRQLRHCLGPFPARFLRAQPPHSPARRAACCPCSVDADIGPTGDPILCPNGGFADVLEHGHSLDSPLTHL